LRLILATGARTCQTLPRLGCGPSALSPLQDRHDKNKQQDRLLAAIVAVSCEHGYEAATVARVIGHAGVSRPTFYEYFAHKQACFVAALEGIERDVLARTRHAIEERPPQLAAAAAITALVSFAQERPAEARFLTHEALAAGQQARDARAHGVERIARLIENAYAQVSAGTTIPALPSEILIGATYRLLALRLVRGECALAPLQADLLDWLAAYERPVEQQRWRNLTPTATTARSPFVGRAPLRAPPTLSPGRPRHSAPRISENHRLRIIFAAAETIRRVGYAATTVAEITRAAGVDGRAFYRQFASKQEALAAVRELAFQNAMAVTAGAFFAGADWPRRVWQAGTTFTQYLEENPAQTYACVVESHAGSPATAQRFQDLVAGFTIFLQEGYEYQPRRPIAPSSVALEAVAQATLEILYRQARSSSSPELAGLLANLAYIALTPFVGAAKADELVTDMQGVEIG
jgi:AcrR family transcriptional regulator